MHTQHPHELPPHLTPSIPIHSAPGARRRAPPPPSPRRAPAAAAAAPTHRAAIRSTTPPAKGGERKWIGSVWAGLLAGGMYGLSPLVWSYSVQVRSGVGRPEWDPELPGASRRRRKRWRER